MTPILKTRSLCKVFLAPQGPMKAIEDIGFDVYTGEFLCIVGPSGCGKTTLLQIIGGLLHPTEGEVLISGQILDGPHPDIGVVFQKPHLMPWRTVMQNILLPLEIMGESGKDAEKRAKDLLMKIGLEGFGHHYPKALSGGMEQRVAVARALINRPRILLLDEPFGALDALTRDRLDRELLHLWRHQNITAVMVTHSIREAVMLSDRVLVLSSRPAMIAEEVTIHLPRPRSDDMEYTREFADLSYQIRQAIRDGRNGVTQPYASNDRF
jgi:NitT/TauT family transport system ATP-binding protein